jgi:hypothetical protein
MSYVEPREISLNGGQQLRVLRTGVVQFISPDLDKPVCLSAGDLAELLRIACNGSMVKAVQHLSFVIERGHRFTELPWVPLRVADIDEDAF